MESSEINEPGHDQQEANGKTVCKHIKLEKSNTAMKPTTPETGYSLALVTWEKTVCTYKNDYNVHKFIEKCPFTPTKNCEDGIS